MTSSQLGVAVVGAGMVGRAHAAGYRAAAGTFDATLPPVRLVAIADVNADFAADAARRFGFERAESSWQAIAESPDVDVVSVAVANDLHREVAEGLLAAGKHVLCEKPMAPSIADAESMVTAAGATDRVAAVGFTFRRSPAIAAIKEQLDLGSMGRPLHFVGRYWCDYGCNPNAPMSWRYQGGAGSGALADIGSHLVDLAEFVGGPLETVRGTVFSTVVPDRPVPLSQAFGHAAVEVSDTRVPVGNEDVATFNATYSSGFTATLSVSRVAFGHPNALGFEVFAESGGAKFDLARAGEFLFADGSPASLTNGYRQVLVGPGHPYISGGMAMDFPGVGYGQNDLFIWQAKAFLEQVAGVSKLPPLPDFAHGLHNLRVLRAITESAERGGAEVSVVG